MTCHAAIVSRELGVPVRRRRAHRDHRAARRRARHRRRRPRASSTRATSTSSRPPPSSVGGRARRARAPRRRRSPRSSTSTWPSPSTPRRSPRWTSTASGCCAPSSWSPTRSAASTRKLLIARGAAEASSSTRWRRRCCASPGPSRPRPVVYRTIDFRTNEFSQPRGRRAVRAGRGEPDDRVPRLLPLRRASPRSSGLELEVLARVRERHPNLTLMIPFVRTAWELEACLELVDASPLGRAACRCG